MTPIQQSDVSLDVNESLAIDNGKNKSLSNSISKETQELDNISEGLKRNKNNIPIDPVLMDITNQDITNTDTHHEILRKAACKDLQIYTDKMANQMNKGRKRVKEYQVGDLVRVAVPKIDRFSVDRPSLPCKIMEKTENGKYRLGSKFGLIEIYYSSGELELLGTAAFPELDEIPSNIITIREAARLQSVGLTSVGICNCKSECNSNKCRCKRGGGNCGSRCHSGRLCKNK